ncbi:MAG: glycosyltransferase family 39 protein [Eubacterium sp.]|nr:glycosyltransferase family 39 protein [Eubacterium sp.]
MGQRNDSGTGKRHLTGNSRKYLIAFLMIWVAQMAAAFYFCAQKQGFHEDEYYTYYGTARTNGFYVEDGQWMDRETYLNEFVVLPDQRFQYGLVRLVQSWDVHPPMYYWVFHTVQSFTPNVFSKWTGLSVNLFFHGINLILLTFLSYLVGGRDRKLSIFVTLCYGFTPAAMSGVVFIRMYEMLTAMVLLCALLHVRAVQADEEKLSVIKYLVPMAVVTYAGFLTQYYYSIFLFYLAVAFGVWMLWRDRNLWNCIRYGIAQGSALILAYLTYPSCLGQMFRGQRGAQATKSFFDLSNTLERFWFFGDLMNRYAFGHLFFVGLVLMLLLAAVVHRKRRYIVGDGLGNDAAGNKGISEEQSGFQGDVKVVGRGGERVSKEFWVLTFAAVGYFLTVSKTALLLGATSNRYQLPIYGIAVLLVLMGIRVLGCAAFASAIRYRKYTCHVVMALCLVAVVLSLHFDGVLFLYPEDREETAFAKECAARDIPAVYFYQKGEEWCVWDVADELFAYPEVYFVEAWGEEPIMDERIRNADELVVYIAGGTDIEKQKERITVANRRNVDAVQRIFSEKYCDVFLFY